MAVGSDSRARLYRRIALALAVWSQLFRPLAVVTVREASARYSPLRSVKSLREAAASLGMTMLRNLTLATSLSGAFPSTAGLDPARFWRHAVTSAHQAVVLARGALLDAGWSLRAPVWLGAALAALALASLGLDRAGHSWQVTGNSAGLPR